MPTNIAIKNTNQRNTIKIITENAKTDPKTKVKVWETPVVTYVPPGQSVDVWISEDRRANVVEMPS